MNHFSSIQFQEYLDGVLDETISKNIRLHLETCLECSAKMKSLKEFELLLRNMPLEHTSNKFTERVMSKLGIEETPHFVWEFFKNLAPVVALALLIGILYVVFQYTGAFQNSHMQQSSGSVYNTLTNTMRDGVAVYKDFTEKYLPFFYQRTTSLLILFSVVFFGAVALLDKYLLVPMMKRK